MSIRDHTTFRRRVAAWTAVLALVLPFPLPGAQGPLVPMAVVEAARASVHSCLVAITTAYRRHVHRRLAEYGILQLTGNGVLLGQTAHPEKGPADPALYETREGRIQIYGTGYVYVEYPSWAHFLRGEGGTEKTVELYHPDGTRIEGEERVWDLILHRWDRGDGREPLEVLYAGAMTPTEGRRQARWPEDNWNRRIYAFVRNAEGKWTRVEEPVFARPPVELTWNDHCYGHHFVTDEHGDTWLFYEKATQGVSQKGEKFPASTQMYVRKMDGPFRTQRFRHPVTGETVEEANIMPVEGAMFPSMRRASGGILVEGPRPFKLSVRGSDGRARTLYLVGFSSGDFPTDNYHVNVAWSESVAGPYRPLLTADGRDLLDLGAELKARLELSWGPARPHFFPSPDGRLWVLFHAVDKGILPGIDYTRWPERLHEFHRNVYLAPVDVLVGPDGVPRVTMGSPGPEPARAVLRR